MPTDPYSPIITDAEKNDAVNVSTVAAQLYTEGHEDEAREVMRKWHAEKHPMLINQTALPAPQKDQP